MLPATVPPGYCEVLYWRISDRRGHLLAINLLAFVMLSLFGYVFTSLVFLFGHPPAEGDIDLLPLVPGVIFLVLVHELTHGIAMRVYGAQPRYGFLWKGLMFYATAPGHAFRRNQYLVVALAPLVSLSLLACCAIRLLAGSDFYTAAIVAILAAVNGSSSTGDLWISTIMLRYPPQAYVVDERDGMRVFLQSNYSAD
jgi:hypothetical protein